MHLKRYRRETVKDALRAVREDLGPDALILSTRMVAASGVRGWFGGRVVEVTAAAERPRMSEDRHVDEPAAGKVEVVAKLCTPDSLDITKVPRRDKAAYAEARRWRWGGVT